MSITQPVMRRGSQTKKENKELPLPVLGIRDIPPGVALLTTTTNIYEKEYFFESDDGGHDGCYVCNPYSLWR